MDLDLERIRVLLPYSAIVLAGYGLYKVYGYMNPTTPLHQIPGPRNGHFLLGNLPEINKSATGQAHQGWADEFGHVVAFRGFLNQPTLMLTDLRALSHVFDHTDVYQKPKALVRFLTRLVGGSVLVAEGEPHRIQRKTLNPAFGAAQIRDQTGIFVDKAEELKNVLTAEASSGSGSGTLIDVHQYFTLATLDIIGRAGFGYDFNALANGAESDELSRSCSTVFKSFAVAPISSILSTFVPGFEFLPTRQNLEVRAAKDILYRIGSQLLAERKASALLEAAQGEKIAHSGARDLLSLLVRANTATDPRERLSDTDVLAQIPTFLVAGHETSASMMSWLFLELASNPSIQSALRAECLANPLRVRTTSQDFDSSSGFKGEAEPLDAAELSALDKLPLLDAVVRETLRLHSPVPCVHRAATRDDVIPLDKPYVDRDGVTRESVTIHKGDTLYISILLVDRMVALWGPDAGQWKPERWMDGKGLPEAVKNVPGVWGNLMTFLGGGRACIGFKFSLYEVKILLHTVITTLSFELSRPREDYQGQGDILQHPMIKSELEKGAQLPLLVRRVEDA